MRPGGDRYLRIEGLNIRYLEEGAGAPVLLLHGGSLGSSADVWIPNLAGFAARGLRAIAFDQPGFGASDDPDDHSVAYRRRFVVSFMDALAIGQAALVGHSQSGRIAVDLAFRHPGRITRVIVLGTGSLLPPLPGKKAEAQEGEEGGLTEPTLAQTRASFEGSVYRRELVTPEAIELRHRLSVGRNFRAFVERKRAARDREEKAGAPLWRRLRECPVPLLLLYGREDRGDAAERAALARQLHPGLDLRLLPECKHLIQWDAAEAFVDLAARFLAVQDARADRARAGLPTGEG